MRVLIDANVLISYFLSQRESPIHSAVESVLDEPFTVLLPEELVTEFAAKVATKPFLSALISQEQADALIEALSAVGERLPSIDDEIPAIARDANDDYLLAHAVLGRADYLVTGDKDLLVLRDTINPLKIRSPLEFTQELDLP